jgi:hypothetical protein
MTGRSLPTSDQESSGDPGTPAGSDTGSTLNLDACRPSERLLVTTSHSVYEIVVVSPRTGEVMIRGGQLFPTFHPAVLLGSVIDERASDPRSIETRRRLWVCADGKLFGTSPVRTVVRNATAA